MYPKEIDLNYPGIGKNFPEWSYCKREPYQDNGSNIIYTNRLNFAFYVIEMELYYGKGLNNLNLDQKVKLKQRSLSN